LEIILQAVTMSFSRAVNSPVAPGALALFLADELGVMVVP
jgi:hypothetical protein